MLKHSKKQKQQENKNQVLYHDFFFVKERKEKK